MHHLAHYMKHDVIHAALTGPTQHQSTGTENSVKFCCVVSEICDKTNKQTDRPRIFCTPRSNNHNNNN